MVDDFAVLTELRALLKTAVAATTGTASLGATAAGYTRTAGSFVDEGFVYGMEVVPTGFASNVPGIISSVTDTVMSIEGGRNAEAVAGGKSLTVGLPPLRSWENMEFTPVDNRWHIDEDYIPGASNRVTLGKEVFDMVSEPTYVLRLNGITGKGVGALFAVSNAILRVFKPNLSRTLPNGDALVIKSSPAPYRGQVLPETASHAVITITVPLYVSTVRT